MAREVWRNVQIPPAACQVQGGMLESATSHWNSCGGDLSRAMDTISSGDNVLETIFSFQQDQVEVFINTEGAPAEDISLRLCPQDGGFELWVAHKQSQNQNWVRREVRRLYGFQRPLFWDQAKASITTEGVLHVVIPGPAIQAHPFPMEPCF